MPEKLCNLQNKCIQELKQELETMRKNRDVAWENLEVTKNKLENKFDDIGQMVSEIVNMCCKNPSMFGM